MNLLLNCGHDAVGGAAAPRTAPAASTVKTTTTTGPPPSVATKTKILSVPVALSRAMWALSVTGVEAALTGAVASSLFESAMEGDFSEVVRAVQRRGFHPDTRDSAGCTLLHWAVHYRTGQPVRGPGLFLALRAGRPSQRPALREHDTFICGIQAIALGRGPSMGVG